MITQLKGSIPVVLTPLTKNHGFDQEGSDKLIDYLIKGGVGGFFVLGSASENFLFDFKLKADAAKGFARSNNGRSFLIVGCSSLAPRDVFNFFDEVADENINGLHFIPYDLKIGSTQLIYQLSQYADKSPFPIYLYHNYKRGRPFTPEEVGELAKHPNIHGIKVGGYKIEEMKAFLALQSSEFQILGSGGGQFIQWLELGAGAVTSSSACCFPKEFDQMYRYYQQGQMTEAKDLQDWWKEFHTKIPNLAPENGEYAAEEKYILKHLGLIQEHCHFPLRQLNSSEMTQIDELMK